MKSFKPLLFALFLLSTYSGYSQAGLLGVSFLSPTANKAYGPAVSVQVKVSSASAYQITSVIASIEGNQLALTYNPDFQFFEGNLSMAGLVSGPKTLTTIVTDAAGNTGSASIPIIYHLPPVINILKPYNNSCARPYLPVKATCFDSSGSCTLSVVVTSNLHTYTLGTFSNAVDTVFDMSGLFPVSGSPLYGIVASNSYNQTSGGGGTLFIDMSPYLTEVYSDSNQIVDFSDNRVLVIRDEVVSSPRIVRITDSISTPITFSGQMTSGGTLTSRGAVFSAPDVNAPGSSNSHLYDWNNGTLDTLSAVVGVGNYVAKGGYCAWSESAGTGIYLKDLVTGTIQHVTGSTSGFDLSADGSVAYIGQGYLDTVVRWQNGVRYVVPDLAFSGSFSPKTDGKRVIYGRSGLPPAPPYFTSIWYFNGTGSSDVSDFPDGSPAVEVIPYQINNGYAAYFKLGTTGEAQLWVTDSAGVSRQASIFSGSSSIDLLNPRGELMYTNYGGRYLYLHDTSINVCSSFGKTYCQDSTWYVAIGRTLFRINPNPQPNKVDSFSLTVKKDSLRTFGANDFSGHFKGDGIMMSIKIMGLPVHGAFKLNGQSVTLNQEIPRTNISQLVYTPVHGFTGVDTIVWNASNGIKYTAANAIVVLRTDSALAPPPMPVISGLKSHYCVLAAAQKIRITNIPGLASGTTVSASIDGQTIPVGSDSTITIDPGLLGVGAHSMKVLFVNATAGDTLLNSFAIDPAVIAKVQLATSAGSVTASSAPVLLTASNISGGGSAPLFTFARDLSFTQIVRAEGSSSSVSVDVESLSAGKNGFFVRMKTSDSCYTAQSDVDSVTITLNQPTGGNGNGLTDPDNPGQVIHVGPNPFSGILTVTGLMPAKSYSISLLNGNGQEIIRNKVKGQQQTVLYTDSKQTVLYYLRVYDETKNREIGVLKVLAVTPK